MRVAGAHMAPSLLSMTAFLTIGHLPNDPENRSRWVIVASSPEQIGELIVWLENWYCRDGVE